jgi:hypothetical protein
MHPIAPQRRPNSPCFMHLFRLVLTRSRPAESRKANQFLAHLALLVGPDALSRPATAQKSLWRGRSPPPAPPPAPLRGALAGLRPAPNPQEGGFSRITSYGRRVQLPQQRIAASPHLLFMCVLGPLFFRSSLYQLVLTRSRCPQLPKANHFLAYLALLAGPEALSHPVTAQNSQGRGRSPPLRAPLHRYAATWPPSPRSPKKTPPSAGDRGQPQSKTHRTQNPAKSAMS